MILYSSAASPFVRKVLVALHDTGLIEKTDVQTVSVSPLNSGDLVPNANPLGKIPCLIRDDGKPLYDSRIITRYLASLAPDAMLYPNDDTLWDILTLEATIDGIMEATVAMSYEMRVRPADKIFDGWLDAQWLKITRALNHIESKSTEMLATQPFMRKALVVALEYIDLRHDARNWRKSHPKLAYWHQENKDATSLKATRPQP